MKKLLEEFFRHYLTERDLEKTLALLSEEVISIGTGEHEIARNKAELHQLMEQEFEALPGPLRYELYNYVEIPCNDTVYSVFANLRAILEVEGEDVVMDTRLTCTWVKQQEQWKIVSVHMSTPTNEQETDAFFPLYYGSQTMQKMSADSGGKLLALMTEAMPGGIMGGYLEEGYPLYTINDKMLEILGYTYEELLEVTGEKMMNIIYEEDRARVAESIDRQFAEKKEYEIEYRAVGKDNRLIWVSDIGKKIITEDGREAMISVMTDITNRITNTERLEREADYDYLTGLYNRKKAVYLVNKEMKKQAGGIFFVCDIDFFKQVNDSRGHLVGDDVLKELALIMNRRAGAMSVLARLGGDEYIMFFSGTIPTETAIQTVADIQEEFLHYAKDLAPELSVALSVGGAVREFQEEVAIDLYRKADEALYLAKQERGALRVFERK